MNDYISSRIDITPCSEDATDLVAAFLSDAGYESFEPDQTGLTAYIAKNLFDEVAIENALKYFPMPVELKIEHTLVEGRDWNEEWEKNYFKPIVIAGRCVVHSTFHNEIPAAEYDIVVDPKMAFGTGHHATTSMMISYLLDIDVKDKVVIDMGTGTGILAILSMMRGAKAAYGIEIDPAACVNARENVALNNIEVKIVEGDSSRLDDIAPCDLFIANINRNIILADLNRYTSALISGGTMLLSGFYVKDIPLLERAASAYGMTLCETRNLEGDWAAIRLEKN